MTKAATAHDLTLKRLDQFHQIETRTEPMSRPLEDDERFEQQ